MPALREKRNVGTAVIEVGRAELTSGTEVEALTRYVKMQRERMEAVVIVHGGGQEELALRRSLGVARRTRDGRPTVSDTTSNTIAAMAAAGLVSTRLVAKLVAEGIAACGISGVDLGMIRTSEKGAELRKGAHGQLKVDVSALEGLMEKGIVPVVASLALGRKAEPTPIDSAFVAQTLSSELDADLLDLIDDIPDSCTGDRTDASFTLNDIEVLINSSVITGRLARRMKTAAAAVEAGVSTVRLGNIRSLHKERATVLTA